MLDLAVHGDDDVASLQRACVCRAVDDRACVATRVGSLSKSGTCDSGVAYKATRCSAIDG